MFKRMLVGTAFAFAAASPSAAVTITFDDLPETNWSVDNKALVAIGRLSQALLEGLPDSP